MRIRKYWDTVSGVEERKPSKSEYHFLSDIILASQKSMLSQLKTSVIMTFRKINVTIIVLVKAMPTNVTEKPANSRGLTQ